MYISPLQTSTGAAQGYTPPAPAERPAEPAPVPLGIAQPAGGEDSGAGDPHRTVERLNNMLKDGGSNLKFQLHEGTSAWMVQLVNPTTDEVVKEFPNHKVLDTLADLQKLAGLGVDITT